MNGKNASCHSLGICDTLSEGHLSLVLLITLVPINTGTFELYLVVGTTNANTVMGSGQKGTSIVATAHAV